MFSVSDVPRCVEDKEEIYGALKQETVVLRCQVEANPPMVTFKWTFNNSGEQAEVPPARYTSTATVSTLNYTPVSEMDYGTLSCWGSNSVGSQKTPCVYQVVAAGRNSFYVIYRLRVFFVSAKIITELFQSFSIEIQY